MTVIKNDVILKFNNTGSNRYPITFEYDEPQQVQVRTYNEATNEYEDITTFEFDGATTLVFTGVVPDTFEIVRVTDISQSYGTANFSQFVPSSAIKAADLNGNLELLRQAIEENSNSDDNLQDQIDDINQDIDDINNTIDGLDNVYVNVTGDTMTGALSMSDNYVRNVKDPQLGTDAVNLSTLQTALDGLPGGDLDAPPYVRQAFTATAGQTVFTLNAVNDFTDGREQVYLNGNLLNRSTDYSTTSLRSVVNTVTLAYGAQAGDVLEILCINYLINLDGQTDLTANNIKYTYPGGVEQTVQNRLEQYVSVLDFGPVNTREIAATTLVTALTSTPESISISQEIDFSPTIDEAEIILLNIDRLFFTAYNTIFLPDGVIELDDTIYMSNPTLRYLNIEGQEVRVGNATSASITGGSSGAYELTISGGNFGSAYKSGAYAYVIETAGDDIDSNAIKGAFRIVSANNTEIVVDYPFVGNQSDLPNLTNVTSVSCRVIRSVIKFTEDCIGLRVDCIAGNFDSIAFEGTRTNEAPADGPADGIQVGTASDTFKTGLNESEAHITGGAYFRYVSANYFKNNGWQILGGNCKLNICSAAGNGWRGIQSANGAAVLSKFATCIGNGASGFQAEQTASLIAIGTISAGNEGQGYYCTLNATINCRDAIAFCNKITHVDARYNSTITVNNFTSINPQLQDFRTSDCSVIAGSNQTLIHKDRDAVAGPVIADAYTGSTMNLDLNLDEVFYTLLGNDNSSTINISPNNSLDYTRYVGGRTTVFNSSRSSDGEITHQTAGVIGGTSQGAFMFGTTKYDTGSKTWGSTEYSFELNGVNLLPSTTNTSTLGRNDRVWNRLYSNTIQNDNWSITADGTATGLTVTRAAVTTNEQTGTVETLLDIITDLRDRISSLEADHATLMNNNNMGSY